jgi:hypothetical protein
MFRNRVARKPYKPSFSSDWVAPVMGGFSGTDTDSGTSRKEMTLLFRGKWHIAQSLRIFICKRRWHCLERLRQLPWLEKKFPVASQN